jgi:tripartite-type tricarboxylate transporter receptor subunit TctC
MARLGLEPVPMTTEELVARIRKEAAMWSAVIRDAGIRLR